MSDEISELWTIVLGAWCTALFLVYFVPTWSYNHISNNRFSLPMPKAIWFRRALQGIGAATWCSFSDALIRRGKKSQLNHGKNMQKPCVMCTCYHSNLSKRFCQAFRFEMLQLYDVVFVWFRLSLAFNMAFHSWYCMCWTWISVVIVDERKHLHTFLLYNCTTVYTYWNQELHNDGSWSPSFMTSLTKIDNLDGIMAGITPKSTNRKTWLIEQCHLMETKKQSIPANMLSQFFPHCFHHFSIEASTWVRFSAADGFFSFSGWTYFETPVYEITKKTVGIWNPRAHI